MPNGEDEVIELPQLDEPPASGAFIEHDDFEITDEEAEAGKRLGQVIDPDDDEDNGLD